MLHAHSLKRTPLLKFLDPPMLSRALTKGDDLILICGKFLYYTILLNWNKPATHCVYNYTVVILHAGFVSCWATPRRTSPVAHLLTFTIMKTQRPLSNAAGEVSLRAMPSCRSDLVTLNYMALTTFTKL